MHSQIKIKFIIFLAILLPIVLFAVIGFQLFKINQVQKEISKQQTQIEQLQNKLDYYENKLPDGEHDSIGE